MLGTSLQFGRVRGEDRFYVHVKGRKNQSHKKQQQQQQQPLENEGKESVVLSKSRVLKPISVSEPHLNVVSLSNLDRFLKSTTPSVPAQYFSKRTMRNWRTCDVEFQPYFTLDDLWESFKEWSVYGVGVPLVLDGSDSVVQYYVPYLSGIQLYGESMQSTAKSSDGDYYRDSSSDGSSDYEIEKGLKFSGVHQEGFSSDEGDTGSSRGQLLFEHMEQDPPYSRTPLADKVLELARRYPGLKTLRSCDLLPVSWLSVAWYPIYRIPTGPTLKDFDACFLTYHTLSTPMRGSGSTQTPFVVYPNEIADVPKLSLPTFGMASYKFKGSMWTQNGVSEHQLANSLQAADDWLRLLHVNQPDFQFFAAHGM